jgi:hypothetical protein
VLRVERTNTPIPRKTAKMTNAMAPVVITVLSMLVPIIAARHTPTYSYITDTNPLLRVKSYGL